MHRMELLRKWLNTAGLRATYENLVKDLLDIGESTAARAIVQLWKGTSTIIYHKSIFDFWLLCCFLFHFFPSPMKIK